MAKDIHNWIQQIYAARHAMTLLAMRLQQPGVTVTRNEYKRSVCSSIPFIATFTYEDGITTNIFFQLMDYESESDVVITNITTLPSEGTRRGLAVQTIIAWARENGLQEIRATQVADPNSQRFWEKNGFFRCPDPNPCGDYIYQI